MGRGSKHSKNAGVMGSEALTYHERKAMGHGTLSERLGKVRIRTSYAENELSALSQTSSQRSVPLHAQLLTPRALRSHSCRLAL